jgi:hypothetical protein
MSPYDMAVRTGYEDGQLQQLGWPNKLGSPRGGKVPEARSSWLVAKI